MPFLLMLPALALGTLAAFLIVHFVQVAQDDPYQRVAILLTVLAADVLIASLAYFSLPTTLFLLVSIFALTKCLTWITLVDLGHVVHYQLPEE